MWLIFTQIIEHKIRPGRRRLNNTGMRDGYDNTFDCHCERDVFNVYICLNYSSYGIHIPSNDDQVIENRTSLVVYVKNRVFNL